MAPRQESVMKRQNQGHNNSVKDSKVSGYQKRKSRQASQKSSKDNETSGDVYEYNPGKLKRSRGEVPMLLDKDEMSGFKQDVDEEDESAGNMKLKFGPDDEDAQVGSEDDEEIESDDAFEGSDDERFAAFKFSKNQPKPSKKNAGVSKSRGVRFEDIDLNEEGNDASGGGNSEDGSDEHEVGTEEGGFMDLSAMLDPSSDPDEQGSDGSGSGDDDDDDEAEEEENDHGGQIESDAEEDPQSLDALNAFIGSLETSTKKRKASEVEDADGSLPSRTRRRILKERTESGPEGEFASGGQHGGKLRLEDLLKPLNANGSSSALLSLNASVKVLKGSKSDPLPAPLPQRHQDRLDREAAYEQTKGEVQKWAPTMKRIKEAEHLSFPLQAPTVARPSTAQLASSFKPSTDLETAIDKLLKDANLREQDMARTEDLKMQELSPEEVALRRGELRKMRDLLYRAEIKAKRVAKIKSKTHRKILRKEKAKMVEKRKDLADGDDSDDDVERLKLEVERALERATLRHKNTGKWARSMHARGGDLEENRRKELEEMYDRGEKLRRRIQGLGDEDDDGPGGGGDSDTDEGDIDTIKAKAYDELQQLQDKEEAQSKESKATGLLGMKFMQTAMARERREVDELEDDFRAELQSAKGVDEPLSTTLTAVEVERTGGRVTYRPSVSSGPPAPSESSSVTLKSSESPMLPLLSTLGSPPPGINPWLEVTETSSGIPRKRNDVIVAKDSGSASKSKNALKKQLRKTQEAKTQEAEDAVVDIDLNNVLKLAPLARSKPAPAAPASDSEEENVEAQIQESLLAKKSTSKGKMVFEQRDLVARAFAGDNVVQEFAEEKRKEIEGDAPKEVDTTIPGWGSWGGQGTKKRPPRPELIKKVAGIAPSHRTDFNKSHVIISERRDKKASKYLVKDLPYPYTSKAQFERSMDVPLGAEWNTRAGFQKGTLPKVIKKMGAIIDPIEKLF